MLQCPILGMIDCGDGCYYEASEIRSITPLAADELEGLDEANDSVTRITFWDESEVYSNKPSRELAEQYNAMVEDSR